MVFPRFSTFLVPFSFSWFPRFLVSFPRFSWSPFCFIPYLFLRLFKRLTPDSWAPAKQRRVADSVGRLGRDSPRKPREGYVELRQAECAVLACMESGPMLNAGCAHVGPSRAHVEPSWAHLGLMLGQVGPMLSHRAHRAYIGPCWAAQVGPMLGYVGLILGPCWAYVGPMLAYVGPMLAHVEPSWELCWGHVWAIYVETILRCQFFRPGPPPGAQSHVKTDVF